MKSKITVKLINITLNQVNILSLFLFLIYNFDKVTDNESDVLSIPVNETAYASQSNKMMNA